MRDDTPVRRDCVVLTGSSARGLRDAVDNLAGRRGPDAARSDRLLLPVGFRRFCELIGVDAPQDAPRLRPTDLFTREAREAFDELSFWIEDLVEAWETYLRIGGFPRAIADFINTGDVGPGFAQDLWDAVRGDAVRSAHLPDSTVLSLLERLGENLASPVNASAVARDVGLADNHRTNDRINDLVTTFMAWRCLQSVDGQPSEAAQRKVYFTDPLLARLAAVIDDQRDEPAVSKLSEQQIGLALLRSIEAGNPGSLLLSTRIMYRRTKTGKEIDFLGPDLNGCVEGKYVDTGWKGEAQTARAGCERGLLATRRAHALDDGAIWAVPAPALAWLLDTGV